MTGAKSAAPSDAHHERRVHIVRGEFIHTLYWEQLRSCPEGFRYDLAAPTSELHALKADLRGGTQSQSAAIHRAKSLLKEARRRSALPNMRFSRSAAPLIHSWQYPLVTRNRWVVDFEDVGAFVAYQPIGHREHSRIVLRALLSSSTCRALLPWTNKARDSLVSELGSGLEAKTHVVYPAVTPRLGIDSSGAPRTRRFLFVGSAFVTKGGITAMRAFARIRQEVPDAELDMVTFLPARYRAEAASVPGLTIHTRASPEELDHLFRDAYALIAPFSCDTFGYVVLEAFAYGVPAITSNSFALPELIGDGQRGAVVSVSYSLYDEGGRRRYVPVPGPHDRVDGHPLIELLADPPASDVESLAREMASALLDKDWRAPRARAALESTRTGPFSHVERRRRLADVYENALT
jgi:glycosyltransferase involved in cell wall biosynthesis